ncbi:MAG: hypothetical protein AMXMBFR45_05600 [Gammaproteobacteria bacterium]|nr:MAG: hypothetical protein EDM71_07350 [Pseudomonadota bacterium]MBC6944989.1 hypothetical protein [Gammaproteobacteria bacterium]MCE7896580.1 hypothetical protein [Gammaproteobacteria bacterium PRO8]MCQ3934369.1 hypothetical protein [Gammaproteobacteria bacterium]GIK35493.1 MAG: hypothetical protein BroJett010_20520 [Gammaproteobacteria bacterium]
MGGLARLFYLCILAGVVLTVLAAGVYPLPQHTRYRSMVSVVPDGGREEVFSMHWPQDRVQPLQAGRAGPIQQAGDLAQLSAADGASASAEIFRVRDVAGNVIGLASRSVTTVAGAAPDAGWVLLIPSRGTLFLGQQQRGDGAPAGGSVTGGTGEFAGLAGSYDEVRQTGKTAADGSSSGQIRLITRVQAAP